YSGDIETIGAIINAVINEPDVISISIINNEGATLSQVKSNIATPYFILNPDKKIIKPIELKSFIQTDDFDSLLVGQTGQQKETIGYVELTLSYEAIKQRQLDILFNTVYITILLLLLIGIIAKFISAAISRPILKLTTDVNDISEGNYKPSAAYPTNQDEIATLDKGIREMARQITEHQEIMAKRVHEATQELRLQNDKLFEAQGAIVKAADAKSRFISHISHEIRTPLNGIIGFLEIIKKTQLDNEQTKLINASYLSSKNLNVIINEVLDFAQLGAGKIVINKSDFQLKQTVQDALMLLSPQAENNGVTLDYQHDTNAPEFINQDCIKFVQILTNLVGNAIKFSRNSTVTITLNVKPTQKNLLEVSIIDLGIGISEENIKLLFKEYSQLDHATSDQGTGLGLVITQQILNALQGEIKVKSTLGEGSTFSFTLPFTEVKDSYSAIDMPVADDTTLPDLTAKKILVADDNEINRLLLSNLLERQHAEVTCVNDGQQAIDIAEQQTFDLMLLDLRMPVKMGNEALFEIRNQPQNPNYKTPAVAITAHITSGEEQASHISSFDGYLIKPIDQNRFFSLVEQLLYEHDYDTQPFVPLAKDSNSAISNKSFDYELAKVSMNADHALMLIMFQKFFSELHKQNGTISQLIQQESISEAAEAVHKVHGSAAYCGTPLLKISSKQLEISLRENDIQNISSKHQKFSNDIETLLKSKGDILAMLKKSLDKQGI
ncbi:MAG: response regulator, partial [Cycloclasticus sp.]|nr:response regulator [Cycloclasticus sp.]